MRGLKSKLLKSKIGGYTQILLSICKKEAVAQQIFQATVKTAKTAKSKVQKLLSSWHDFLQTFMINANPVLVKYRNSPRWVSQASMGL